MTTAGVTTEAAPSEIEASSPVVWEAFIVDASGFVISTHEDLDRIIDLFPDEQAIDREFGDAFPEQIIIAKDTARPRPQSPGSKHLRQPSSHLSLDLMVEIELDMVETSEDLMLLWKRARAMADGLNRHQIG